MKPWRADLVILLALLVGGSWSVVAHGADEPVPAAAASGEPVSAAASGESSQADDAEQVRAARQLGRQGLALYQRRDWAAAYDKLAAASRLHRAPTLLLYMARCERNRRRLIEARDLYEAVVREELAADASSAFVKAQASARTELAEVIQRIPSVRVVTRGAAGAPVSLRVDGTPVAAAQWRGPVPLNPGPHTFTAAAPGSASVSQRVELADTGATVPVELVLLPAVAPDDDSARGSDWAAGVGFGTAGAGLLVGIITGALAHSTADDVKSRCQGDLCQVADESRADDARSLATVSTVSFVVAGAGAGAGIIALVAGAIDASPAQPDSAWRLEIGPASLGLIREF